MTRKHQPHTSFKIRNSINPKSYTLGIFSQPPDCIITRTNDTNHATAIIINRLSRKCITIKKYKNRCRERLSNRGGQLFFKRAQKSFLPRPPRVVITRHLHTRSLCVARPSRALCTLPSVAPFFSSSLPPAFEMLSFPSLSRASICFAARRLHIDPRQLASIFPEAYTPALVTLSFGQPFFSVI